MPKTGATRYQKFLKAEKAKTKLKGKKDKELPKGTNVTTTNFKVKKIVIKEQLKNREKHQEALSTRKLNVKELLSRLNHFNTNSRTDALNGLKEVISLHPEVLNQNLGDIIHGITTLILNIEKVVRQGALKVLHLVLSNVNSEKINPFFDVLSTYLRSAMTHIDSRIQEDSLFFLDILLLCCPLRIAKDFHKIIPNFLDMISKLRIDAKPGRTLTVNLNSQITSVKWRVKVFERLQEFLHKYAIFSQIYEDDNSDSKNTQIYNVKCSNYFPLFNPNSISNCNISFFSGKTSDYEQKIDEVEKFIEYTDTLMPLIFETWLEACPNKKSDTNFEMVINEESALLLKHILQVISLLRRFVKYYNKKSPSSCIEKIFSQKFKDQFTQHFVKSFPYVTNIRSRQVVDTNNVEGILDSKLVAENLEICHLFIMLNPNIDSKSQNLEVKSVLGYIEKTFYQSTDSKINSLVVSLLHSVFSKEITGWTRTQKILDNLFRKIIWIYFNNPISDSFKQDIFALLCTIALNDKLSHFHRNEDFEMWLKKLPDILLENRLTTETVDIIHKFAVTNNKIFNLVMKDKLIKIIENLPNIKIIDAADDIESYHKMLSILYWIKVWDKKSLDLLETQLMENVYMSDHGIYIMDTLKLITGEKRYIKAYETYSRPTDVTGQPKLLYTHLGMYECLVYGSLGCHIRWPSICFIGFGFYCVTFLYI